MQTIWNVRRKTRLTWFLRGVFCDHHRTSSGSDAGDVRLRHPALLELHQLLYFGGGRLYLPDDRCGLVVLDYIAQWPHWYRGWAQGLSPGSPISTARKESAYLSSAPPSYRRPR